MDYYVLDLDGPNYAFLKNLALVAAELTGRPVEEFSNTQDEWSSFMKNWGISLEEFMVIFAIGVRQYDLLWEGDPVPGAQEGWHELLRKPYAYIHVVTDRNPFGAVEQAHEATNYWLANHGMQYDAISFVRDKVSAVEENLWENFRQGDLPDRIISVDDKPENCMAFAEAGYDSLVFDLPANRHLSEDLQRVSSMVEVARY